MALVSGMAHSVDATDAHHLLLYLNGSPQAETDGSSLLQFSYIVRYRRHY